MGSKENVLTLEPDISTDSDYQPTTKIGRTLLKLQQKVKHSRADVLTMDEIASEVEDRRSGRWGDPE